MAAVRIPHPFSVYVPQWGKIISEAALLKFMFSKKATKIDQIFTIDLMFTKCQINGEEIFQF